MKKILLTGSTGGIGEAIVKELSSSGYSLFITGRKKEKLEALVKQYKLTGCFAVDLTKPQAVQTLIDECGEVDILINNAGEYFWGGIEKADYDTIHRLTLLNFQVPYQLIQRVVQAMKQKKWGRILNIASISGVVGEPNASLYSATKAALLGLTKSLALELAEDGITINCVSPGWVKTPILEQLEEDQLTQEFETVPMKRWIEPAEVAQAVKFLVSADASSITGQSINICAGLTLG
jgi:NAD(P)-dependent dehydrogenase (short-subunit alcohol dehydrogenase family)